MDHSGPLVSVCLLTYMHEKYIEDCLKGVLGQTYDHMEIIILDDGSTDGTFRILQENLGRMQDRFQRVELRQNKKNTGNISQNVNSLIRCAKGEYIKLITGDDIMRANCVEQMTVFMEQHPDHLMCYANVYVVDEAFRYGDNPGNQYFFEKHKAFPQKEIFGQLMKLCYVSPSILVRKSMYEKYGYYDETIHYEDYDMWLRMGKREEFLYLPQKLEYYRRGNHSKTNYRTKGGRERFIWMIKEEQKVIRKHLKGLPEEEKKKYIGFFYDRFIWAAKEAGLWRTAIQLAVKKRYDCDRNRK